MAPPDARASRVFPKTEQEAWREERMYGCQAFIAALRIADSHGSVSGDDRVFALRLFFSSVFKLRLFYVPDSEEVFTADVKRPDGKVRNVLVRPGNSGFYYYASIKDIVPYGSEKNVKESEHITFLDLAHGIVD